MIEIPAGIRAMAARGPEWQSWVDGLATVTGDHVDEWELQLDGEVTHGSGSLILPVRTAEAAPAILKVSCPAAGSQHEHLVLRRWGGHGAVRLLRADPRRRVVLLERLHAVDLDTLPDVEACEVAAGLYRQIHVPALPQLPSLAMLLDHWLDGFAALPRDAGIPHRLVEQAMTLGRDLSTDATTPCVLHGDLHGGHVLAAERAPWVAISPKPLNGDPHYEVAPMLWHRWDAMAGHVRDGVRTRFHTIIEAAGFDEGRARAWTIVRVVHEAAREVRHGNRTDSSHLTMFVAIAKAVQD